jgi:hypothetical protein
MKDWRFMALIAVHELIEAILCKKAGISSENVTAFDLAHEALGLSQKEEPGDNPYAPYQKQHQFANLVEAMLVGPMALDIDPEEYLKAIEQLYSPKPESTEAQNEPNPCTSASKGSRAAPVSSLAETKLSANNTTSAAGPRPGDSDSEDISF